MLMHTNTVLEVERLSKIYSRVQNATRQRLAGTFWRTLVRRPTPPINTLKAGEFWGLKNVSFSLERGEALGVIGLNGSGKTTLLRLLAGQLLPDEGETRILGKTASMINLTAGFQMTASGKQNIFLRGAMLGRSSKEIDATYDEIVDFAELGDAIDAPVATYSSGMMMRLAFSIMVAMQPDVLFIDEVLSVGDFRFRQKCLGRIRELRERAAFVLVSHGMADIKLFCSKVIVLHEGNVAFAGEPEEAIKVYEEMQLPQAISREDRHREALKPQYHNDQAITDVKHYWCDAKGKKIEEIQSGKTLYFRVSFILAHKPKNLILGVPVWTEGGVYVTGFSTKRDGTGMPVEPGQRVEFMLEVLDLAFNPGDYISNLAIHDGPEFLYRGGNAVLSVRPDGRDCWGMVTFPHTWKISE